MTKREVMFLDEILKEEWLSDAYKELLRTSPKSLNGSIIYLSIPIPEVFFHSLLQCLQVPELVDGPASVISIEQSSSTDGLLLTMLFYIHPVCTLAFHASRVQKYISKYNIKCADISGLKMKSYNDIKSKVLCCNGSYGIIAKVPTALYVCSAPLLADLGGIAHQAHPQADTQGHDVQSQGQRHATLFDKIEEHIRRTGTVQ